MLLFYQKQLGAFFKSERNLQAYSFSQLANSFVSNTNLFKEQLMKRFFYS